MCECAAAIANALPAREDGGEQKLPVYGINLLIAGSSGSGKSTLTAGIMERLSEARYQFCALDPEGNYRNFEDAVGVGGAKRELSTDEAISLLASPCRSVIVNLRAVPFDIRPECFERLLPKLRELSGKGGRDP